MMTLTSIQWTDGAPIYRQLKDRVIAMMLDGVLKPGDALPSERALMDSLKVGRPAIREAMQSLEQTGLIQIRHGERARGLGRWFVASVHGR